MVGVPIVFTYFHEFLSSQLNSSAVNLLRTEAALRMRVAAARQSAIHDRAVDYQQLPYGNRSRANIGQHSRHRHTYRRTDVFALARQETVP